MRIAFRRRPALLEAPGGWAAQDSRSSGGRVRGALAWLLVLAIALGGVGFAQTARGTSILRHLGLTGKEPGYTALAFQAPGKLPATLPSSRLRLGFTIENRQRAARAYDWTVLALVAGRARQLASGTERVADGQTVRIAAPVHVPCTGHRMRVEVHLSAPAESIGYWTRCAAPVRGGSSSG